MKFSLGRFQIGYKGCSSREIEELEARFGVRLPSPYCRFLSRFGRDGVASPALRGSDYYMPLLFSLRAWAEDLLKADGSAFTLHPQDFVLFMHQGYQFCYFRADGASDDPPVFFYFEDWMQPEQRFSTLSDWLKTHGVYVA